MTRRFDRDRRRIAYLLAISSVGMAWFLVLTNPDALNYTVWLALGGFVTLALIAIGVPVDPRRYNDDDQSRAPELRDAGSVRRRRDPPFDSTLRDSERRHLRLPVFPGVRRVLVLRGRHLCRRAL